MNHGSAIKLPSLTAQLCPLTSIFVTICKRPVDPKATIPGAPFSVHPPPPSDAASLELHTPGSTAASIMMRHPGTDDKIIIGRETDGHWTYFSLRKDEDNGTVPSPPVLSNTSRSYGSPK